MRIILAYLGVILLWATTPLAIKWSGEGPGFIFGSASRMTIGASCMLLFCLIRRQFIPFHRAAKITYLVISVQIYGAMLAVYWGAQYIPSGWISVIFGLSPFLTAIFTALWLNENNFSWLKLGSYIIGLAGLWLIFSSALQLSIFAVYGILAVLLAVFLQTLTAVWVKRINAKLPAVAQVTGGLLFALPAYFLSWIVIDHAQYPSLSPINIASTLYLGAIASTVGFGLYYYLLIHISATSVAMIPLISPVLALYIGHTLNHESIGVKVMTGTAFILFALIMHEFFDYWFNSHRPQNHLDKTKNYD